MPDLEQIQVPLVPNPGATTVRREAARKRSPKILVLLALLSALLSITPVLYLVFRAGLQTDRLRQFLGSPSTRPLTINTIALVFSVTTLSVLIGVSLAVLVTCTDIPGRHVWLVLFTLPLGVPSFVSTYTWVALGFQIAPRSTAIYSLPGVVLILSLSLFPYVYLPTVAALSGMDASHEAVARSLGYSRSMAFLRVSLPLLRRAISAGALVIALHMLAEYGALQLLRYRTLTTAIVQRATVLGSLDSARALSIVLLGLALVLLAGDFLLFRSATSQARIGSGVAMPRTIWRLGALRIPLLALGATVVLLSLGIPLYGMLRGIIPAIQQPSTVDWAALLSATKVTALYAVIGAIICTLAALPISVLVTRYPSRTSLVIERVAWITHALPGVIVSLALIFISARWFHPFYQTSAVLIAGYSILYLPIAIGAQRTGLGQAQPILDRVAGTLGAGSLRTFLTVTAPLALPGILAGAMLAMLNISKELTMTLLLRPTGVHTLTTRIWSTTNGDVLDFQSAAPYAVTMLVLTAIPTWLLIRDSLSLRR